MSSYYLSAELSLKELDSSLYPEEMEVISQVKKADKMLLHLSLKVGLWILGTRGRFSCPGNLAVTAQIYKAVI